MLTGRVNSWRIPPPNLILEEEVPDNFPVDVVCIRGKSNLEALRGAFAASGYRVLPMIGFVEWEEKVDERAYDLWLCPISASKDYHDRMTLVMHRGGSEVRLNLRTEDALRTKGEQLPENEMCGPCREGVVAYEPESNGYQGAVRYSLRCVVDHQSSVCGACIARCARCDTAPLRFQLDRAVRSRDGARLTHFKENMTSSDAPAHIRETYYEVAQSILENLTREFRQRILGRCSFIRSEARATVRKGDPPPGQDAASRVDIVTTRRVVYEGENAAEYLESLRAASSWEVVFFACNLIEMLLDETEAECSSRLDCARSHML